MSRSDECCTLEIVPERAVDEETSTLALEEAAMMGQITVRRMEQQMKSIYLNLKRFDIPAERGGVNRIAPSALWGRYIVQYTQETLKQFTEQANFTMYFPEAHILAAVGARSTESPVRIGCQGIFQADTAIGGNFGAFTSERTANSMAALGCESVLIGHCEERNVKMAILAEADVADTDAINRILNREIKSAQAAGLDVLYCIGEKSEEQTSWQQVLGKQLDIGLEGVDKSRVTIAYEPIWSIGPGKVPADKPYIEKIARFIKERTGGMRVVYGGGLKEDNAQMLSEIEQIDGGLIALTRFSGEIGFYPEEYLEIIRRYLRK